LNAQHDTGNEKENNDPFTGTETPRAFNARFWKLDEIKNKNKEKQEKAKSMNKKKTLPL